jgi:phenylalanyl-tRNA synthetase beta chain
MINFLKRLFTKSNSKTPYANIFAAKVLDVQKHPNADRLRIAKLSLGDKIIEPVVCGAFNFNAGDVVVLALPGATIAQDYHSADHKPFILGKAKIRGIESQGMIMSGFELGLSDKPEEGIVILKNDVLPGSEFRTDMVE